eukprot:RCo013778
MAGSRHAVSGARNFMMLLLGAPGSGKGTYAGVISRRLGLTHLATGDLVRAEIHSGSALGKAIRGQAERGELVQDGLVAELLRAELLRLQREKEGANGVKVVLEGFPRTLEQIALLETALRDTLASAQGLLGGCNGGGGSSAVDYVLELQLKDEHLVRKMAGRRICRSCGHGFNLVTIVEPGVNMPAMPPKVPGVCDACGGELTQRPDDQPEVIARRVAAYHGQAEPILRHYREAGVRLEAIDVSASVAVCADPVTQRVSTAMADCGARAEAG